MAEDNKPNLKTPKVNPYVVYGILIVIFILISVFSGGSSFKELMPVNTSEFNEILEKGDVEKVIVYNKTEAEVFLSKKALLDTVKYKAVYKDYLNRPNNGPHYILTNIGNDELFQNKLEKAVAEKRLKATIFYKKKIGLE